jgi:hypothetical protein
MGSARRNTIRLAAVGLCVALCAGAPGCHKPAPAPGGATSSKAEKARKDAEALALGGASGGASAQARAEPETRKRFGFPANIRLMLDQVAAGKSATPPAPNETPAPSIGPAPGLPTLSPTPVVKGPPGPKSTPRSGWVIREHVVCKAPSATEAEAEADVLELARSVVERKLAELDPPLAHEPSLGEVRTEFLRKDSRAVHPPSADERTALSPYILHPETYVYVEYDVEVTADQVRELRAQARVSAGLRVVGLVLAVALAGFLFLRADEWTKGYLTRWLALAAVTLGGGVAAALLII